MKKLIPVVLLISAVFTSCIKEFPSNPNEPLGGQEGQLKKMVTISLPDSAYRTTQEFAYNANGKLVARAIIMNNLSMYSYYYRDAQGRIIKIANASSHNNWDTAFLDVVYVNSTSTRVSHLSDSSAVYEYNASNQVSRVNTYERTHSGAMRLAVYHLYSYDGNGNMIKREQYSDHDGNGVFELVFTYRLEYDTFINPLYTGDDALTESTFLSMSQNNVIKQKNDVAAPGGLDDENVTVFQHRSDNKPHSSLFTGNGGQQRTYFYYY
jgi:hypothetical protein